MNWWKRILTGDDEVLAPRRLDYLNEGLALERQGDLEAAITSYQLALRDEPHNTKILQFIAIALSKTGRIEEAIRHYRRALELDETLVGAHYGLAFLLIRRGDTDRAVTHLRQFLARPPRDPEMARWVEHAKSALERLEADPQGELV